MNQCKACGLELLGEFCHGCGQKYIEERFTFRKIVANAFSVIFSLEKGLFFTLRELLKDPRKVIHGYINGQTKKYYNPIAMVFIMGSVVILLTSLTGVYEGMGEQIMEMNRMLGQSEEDLQRSAEMMKYVYQFQNILMLIMIPFISLFIYLFYKSSGLYFAEINILMCYATALNMLSSLIFVFFYKMFEDNMNMVMGVGMIVSFIIYAYVLRSYFKESWLISFIYSSLGWILGYVTTIVITAIFTVILVLIFTGIKKGIGF